MALIAKPGIYLDVPEAVYHADCCVVPSLSSSIARIIYEETPYHARHWHPRLRPPPPGEIEKPDRPVDIGSAFHKVMLGRGREIDTLPFDDYKKKDAQAMRDESRAAGNIPILQTDMLKIEKMNAAAVEQLVDMGRGDIFSSCDTEVTLVWEEPGGVWCRARLDALPKDAATVAHLRLPELKSTEGSADVDVWGRRYFDNGNDIQSAFYRRGLMHLLLNLETVTFEHVVFEQRPPNAANILTASNQTSAEADRIVDVAISLWGECMRLNQWPGYQGGIVETANWRSVKREEKNLALLRQLMEWQAP